MNKFSPSTAEKLHFFPETQINISLQYLHISLHFCMYFFVLDRGISWGAASAPNSLKGQEKKQNKTKKKGKKKREKEGKKGKKKEKDKSTWWEGSHLATSMGPGEENFRGAKLMAGRGGGWGRHSSTLYQGAKINGSLDPPVCDLLDTPLLEIQQILSKYQLPLNQVPEFTIFAICTYKDEELVSCHILEHGEHIVTSHLHCSSADPRGAVA